MKTPPRFVQLGLLLAACLLGVLFSVRSAGAADDEFFERKIRPVLAGHCFRCHGGEKVSQDLRVDSREALLKGGASGPAIEPGHGDSLLLRALRYADDAPHMPPDKPLEAEQLRDFAAWVAAGAPWPQNSPPFAGELRPPHWAFLPIREPLLPGESTTENPIDVFIDKALAEHNLAPLGPADKKTLLRRATFDLTGLPPTPEEVETFLKDESPGAIAEAVDRLLASPQYGEKWGRHWLDVVRYADTAGETADFPVPHAWRYRNYVIDSFNRDKPYDEFLREQIAGDLLAARLPNESRDRYAELVTATGYLAIARRFGFDSEQDHYLTIDDTIDIVGKSVLGLALGCARCHDHKYDPIGMADYYSLFGVFESTKFAFPGCEKTKAPRDMAPLMPSAEWESVVAPYRQRLADLDARVQQANDAQAAAAARLKEPLSQPAARLADGQIDEGGSQEVRTADATPLDRIEVRAGEMLLLSISPRGNHGADSTLVEFAVEELGGAQRRWNVTEDCLPDLLAGNPHADRQGHEAVWCFFDLQGGPALLPESVRDQSGQAGLHAWRRGDTPSAFINASDKPIKVWTELPPRTFFVHPSAKGPVGVAWLSPIDGSVCVTGRVADAHPGGPDGVDWRIDRYRGDIRAAVREQHSATIALAALQKERADLTALAPLAPLAYAVAEGQPHNARIHVRGDPKSLGDEVPRRNLQLLGGQPLPDGAGSGRRELAQWLTARDNPLTARVMVNRAWRHHFGAGLVRTPNDFGTRGEPPSHPELLDWLAARFMDDGWSLKALHRRIVLSRAYQRAGGEHAENETADPNNVWLWRFPRRRLSAEEIRDGILAVSGDLDRTRGTAHPFPEEKTWGFTQHSPFSAVYDHDRRSVYLMLQRIERHPFLALFDGPDASASTPNRYTTTVPTQALFFMNDPFVHAKAANFANRLLDLPDDAARLDRAYRLLYARAPSPVEQAAAAAFLTEYGTDLNEPHAERPRLAWEAWLRVMLGSNEFLYVD